MSNTQGNYERPPSPTPPSPPPPPPQQNPEESPRRDTISGGSSPHAPSPQIPRRPPPFSPLPGYVAPVMGVRGQSAFSTYTGPSQPMAPHPHRITAPQLPIGFPGPHPYYGIPGAIYVPLPVIHSSVPSGSGSGGALGIVGMQNPAARKRVREGGDAAAGSGENPPGSGAGGAGSDGGGESCMTCSVCAKQFGSSKALFGHMRSHPGRGWKGAHPPPTFSAANEFADLVPGLARHNNDGPNDGGGDAAEEGGDTAVEAGGDGEAGGGGGEEVDGGRGERQTYRVPDLNSSPPADQ